MTTSHAAQTFVLSSTTPQNISSSEHIQCRLSSQPFTPARLGSARLGPARPGSARLGSARLGSARLGSARPGSARLGSARLGSARPGSARLGSAWDRRVHPVGQLVCLHTLTGAAAANGQVISARWRSFRARRAARALFGPARDQLGSVVKRNTGHPIRRPTNRPAGAAAADR